MYNTGITMTETFGCTKINFLKHKNLCRFWPVLAFFLPLIGCHDAEPTSGYTSRSLYNSDIETVCVDMFQSDSFRRGAEFNLTRSVCQQLELHSPYKIIADRRKADTVLYGSISSIEEKALTQQRELDRPMQSQIVVIAQVTWKDLRSGDLIMDNKKFKVSGQYANLLAAGENSAIQEAVNEMAIQIVQAMEDPW